MVPFVPPRRNTTTGPKRPDGDDGDDGDRYELRVQGLLGPGWEPYFDGLAIDHCDDGTSVISGVVVDQAALHGLLHLLRDIGLPLVSLSRTTENHPLDRPEGN
jgi:hypothetical protein